MHVQPLPGTVLAPDMTTLHPQWPRVRSCAGMSDQLLEISFAVLGW